MSLSQECLGIRLSASNGRPTKMLALVVSLMLGVVALPVFAAPTMAQLLWSFQGPTPLTSPSFSASVPAGDDISVQIDSPGNPKGSAGPTSADVVITDSVDGVAFVACNFYYDPTNNTYAALYHHVAVSPGTRTITITQPNSTYVEASAADATGFLGTPTCDGSLNVTGGSTTQVTSASLSPAVTGQNNEIAFFVIGGGGYFPTVPSGYTNLSMGQLEAGYNIQATAGTSVSMSGTYNTPATWDGVIGGIYDASGQVNPLGMNLEQLAYYATEMPFLNIMKSGGASTSTGYSVGWMTATNSNWPDTGEEAYLQLDSDGYPTSLTASPTPTGGQVFNSVLTLINYNMGGVAPGASSCYQAGTYRLKYKGQGTVVVSGEGHLTLSNSSPNTYVSNTFTVTPGCAGSGIILSITAINSSTDYPRDISVVYQPYAASYDAGATFTPAFLSMLAPFSSLRFMEWKNTNAEFYWGSATASINSGATSLTLTSAWNGPSGSYPIVFIDGEQRSATFTVGSTAVTWTGGLTNTLSNAGNWVWGSQTYYTPFYVVSHQWTNRAKPSNAFWDNSDGVPLEVIVDLCNQIQANCHVNVPMMYSDADIAAMGQLIMSGTGMQSGYYGLASTLTATFELSNEVWNCGFNQCNVASSLGGITWPTQSAGGGNSAWNENYMGMRTAQMASDLQTAVGTTIFTRVLPTLGSQWANTNVAITALTTSYWSAGPATNYPIKSIAIAPYWGGNPNAGDCGTMTGVADPVSEFFATLTSQTGTPGNGSKVYTSIPGGGWYGQANGWTTAYASLMSSYPGLKLIAYEGGDNFYAIPLCAGWPALVTAAERDTRMGTSYTTELNFWKTNVGATSANIFNVFQDVGVIGINGSFGLLESIMQPISPLSGAPAKYKAAATFAQ
jgi:hypothetical protein